jgi:hypothetical protein
MRRTLAAVGLALSSIPTIVHAEIGRITNGHDLLQACKDSITFPINPNAEHFNMGFCSGMVPAVGNTFAIYQVLKPEAAIVCLPEKQFTQGQAIRVVIKYLEDHPETLHEDPMKLTVMAYVDAYPCNRSQ